MITMCQTREKSTEPLHIAFTLILAQTAMATLSAFCLDGSTFKWTQVKSNAAPQFNQIE